MAEGFGGGYECEGEGEEGVRRRRRRFFIFYFLFAGGIIR